MTSQSFTHWIDRLYATENDEFDCQQLQAALPAFVDAENENKPFDPVILRRIKNHLHQCPDCHELYNGLKYVVANDPVEAVVENLEEALPAETAVALK